MYLTLIRKELLHNILSLRYLLALGLFVALTLAATVARTHVFERMVKDHAEARTEQFRTLQMAERFSESRGLGLTIEKQPNPLSIFASGLENEMTRSYSMSVWMMPRAGFRKLANPSFRYFMDLDMVLVINLLCSLLALLLVFDSVCGEREQGTLKVLLAGPLPRDAVITAKLASGLVTVLAPLLLSWALCLLYVSGIRRIELDTEQVARLVWVIAVSALYLGFFFALGVAVSSWVQRSATALSFCLFFWMVFVLAIPNLAPMMVNHLAPLPPQSKIAQEREAANRYVTTELMPKWRQELSETGLYKNWDELWTPLLQRIIEESNKRSEKLDRYYNNLVDRQLRLNQYISRLSPSASFVFTATHFAGTGPTDFITLMSEIDAYRYAWDKKGQDLDTEHRRKSKDYKPNEWHQDAIDPSVWPAFSPKSTPFAAVLNESVLDIVMLAGGMVLLLMAAVVGFLRYDPR